MATVPDAGRSGPSTPRNAGAEAGEALSARLRELAETAAAPEDAFEPALRAVLEATKAGAGAICLYDQRHDLLRLAAEAGLSDEGCRRLRTVRKGDVNGWDMPLHGMLNRRAYLIETAARNRYVPPLVEQSATVRTVACLPLYSGPAPLGSLILVTLMPNTFSEFHIRLLEQPLREIVGLIEAVRRRPANEGAAAPPPTVPPTPDAPPPPTAARPEPAPASDPARRELDRVTAALEAAHAERAAQAEAFARREQALLADHAAQIDRLRARLAESEAGAAHEQRAREELQAALERATSGHGDAQHAVEAVRRAESARAAAVAEAARLAGELTALRATAGSADEHGIALEAAHREQQRLAAALDAAAGERAALEQAAHDATAALAAETAELDRVRGRLADAEAAAARELRAREAMTTATDADHVERERALHEAIETARLAEQARDAALGETAAVRAEVARLGAVGEQQAADLGRLRAENDRLRTELAAAHAARGDLERALETARAGAAEAAAAHAAAESALEALRAERVAAAAELEAASAERDRLRDALGAAEAERARLAADVEGGLAARASLEDAHAQALAEVREREQSLRARLTERERELEAAAAERDALAARIGTDEADATSAVPGPPAAEVAELVARIEAADAERDELRALVATLESERATPAAPEAAAPPPAPDRAARPRVAGLAAALAPRPGTAAPAPGIAGRLVVIDADAGWDAAAGEHDVRRLAPADDVVAGMRELQPARILVNLAAKGALDAIAAVRADGVAVRFWGCIADPRTSRALVLGMVEFAARPLDPDAVLASLGAWTARGTRVVTVGADVDALVSLRQALSRQGLSVSMAWDAKQAAELLGMVRPDVMVIDLGLPARDGAGIVVRLAGADPVPHMVLVAGASDPGPALALAAAAPDAARLARPLDRVLAHVLAASEQRPAERR